MSTHSLKPHCWGAHKALRTPCLDSRRMAQTGEQCKERSKQESQWPGCVLQHSQGRGATSGSQDPKHEPDNPPMQAQYVCDFITRSFVLHAMKLSMAAQTYPSSGQHNEPLSVLLSSSDGGTSESLEWMDATPPRRTIHAMNPNPTRANVVSSTNILDGLQHTKSQVACSMTARCMHYSAANCNVRF
jgi:hypothetical protein